MKTAKRVLAILVTLIMVVGTCTVAASAAGTLQAKIDNGDDTITLTANTTESITVKRSLTINLNGYRLLGKPGDAAITVIGNDDDDVEVTVTDGQVISVYPDIDINAENAAEQIKAVFNNSPAAIVVKKGASLTVDGVRLVGGMVKIPMVNEFVPTGSAIMSYDRSNVTIKRSSLYGDYGVNNKVMNGVPGAAPVIEDAVIFAYTKAVKGSTDFNELVAPGSELIDVVGRISGALKGGRRLDADEQELLGNLLNERTLLITKTADQILTDLEKDLPKVIIRTSQDTAEVSAETINYAWSNTKGTDCSYILVPEGVTLNNGAVAPLGSVDKTLLDTEKLNADDFVSQIVYRVEFKMGDESAPYIKNISNYIDLDWVLRTLDSAYADAYSCPASPEMDSYTEILDFLGEMLVKIDHLGSEEVPGITDDQGKPVTFNQAVEGLTDLRYLLHSIGGNVVYKAGTPYCAEGDEQTNRAKGFSKNWYAKVYGVDKNTVEWPRPDGVCGTLDIIENLRTVYETYTPLASNTDSLGDLAVWMYTDVYPGLIDALDRLVNEEDGQLPELLAMLNSATFAQVVDYLELTDDLQLVQKGITMGRQVLDAIEKAQKNGDVAAVFDYLDNNIAKVKGFVDKAVDALINWTDYIAIDELVVGDYVKTYSTLGSIDFDEIDDEETAKLNLTLEGQGDSTVTITGSKDDGATAVDKSVDFVSSFTLTANEAANKEFLYWANNDNQANTSRRILSTEKTFTMKTNITTDIVAVFNEKGPNAAKAIFTNPNGAICGTTAAVYDGQNNRYSASVSGIADPYIGFMQFGEWPGKTAEGSAVLTDALDNHAYLSGNSAFPGAKTFYGEDGAILQVRKDDSSSFIITPTYTSGAEYTVTLYDAGQEGTATGRCGQDCVVWNSMLGSNSYWVDSNNKIVSVTSELNYLITGNATLTSKEGATEERFVINTTKIQESDKVSFCISRSSKENVVRTGVVFSGAGFCDPAEVNTLPEIDGENCMRTTVVTSGKNGSYIIAFGNSDKDGNSRSGKVLYLRPYIEFADGGVEYGDLETWTF